MNADRIRVLHVLHSSAFGGGPAMVELLCSRLHGPDFEMALVSSGEGEMPARLTAMGMRVYSLPLASKGSFLRHLPGLRAIIRKEGPDVVHLHGHFAASLGQFAVQAAGRPPCIYSAQWPAYLDDVNAYSRVRNGLAEWLSCTLAARVVAVSEHDRTTLIRRHLCSPGKLTLIYNAYDPAVFAGAPPPTPTGRGAVIGFIGRLVDQKGCDVLIKAMPAVLARQPGARLRIVGDGPERRRLEGLRHELGVDHAVDFLGYQRNSSELIRQFDVVVVPSRYEPFGIVAVEAMASARPVVASAVGGLSEIVDDPRTGRLVPPGDAAQLAVTLIAILEQPQTLTAMGIAARTRVEERFSPATSVAAYAAEYRRVARRH